MTASPDAPLPLRPLAPLATALAALILATALRADTPTNDDCLMCHEDATLERSDGTPVGGQLDRFPGSVHGQLELACTDCHADLADAELPHAEQLAPVDCSVCHDDAVQAFAASAHGQAHTRRPDSPAASCGDCHGAHDILPTSDPASRTYHLNVATTCSVCHGDAEVIASGGIEAGNVAARYHDSIHGRALERSGLLVAPSCVTCHGAHEIRAASDERSRVYRTHVPEVCGKCHEGIRRRYDTSVHGTLQLAGDPRGAVCTDCHTAHDIQSHDLAPWRLDVVRECGTCHEQSIATYRDTFHGQVTNLGFTRVATCADCHGSHEIVPRQDPRSQVNPANLQATCGRCHEGANANFVQYQPHADPSDREKHAPLYWTTRFMQLLLLGVFAFFGIHTALWVPRSLQVRRRRSRERALAAAISPAQPSASAPSPAARPSGEREGGDEEKA